MIIVNLLRLKGYGHRIAPMLFGKRIDESRNSDYILSWTRQAVLDAYKHSGLSIGDIDAFETHDCYTSSEYVAISAFGITGPAKEHEAIESGKIAFWGRERAKIKIFMRW